MPKLCNVVVLISGSGSNLQALIDSLRDGATPARIRAVISNRADAYGLERARQAGIQTEVLDHKAYADRESFDQALAQRIDAHEPHLVILAGFMRILSADFVRHYQGRLLNIHPSLLPRHKGLHTHQRALEAGDREHGCSVHFVTEELDGGATGRTGSNPGRVARYAGTPGQTGSRGRTPDLPAGHALVRRGPLAPGRTGRPAGWPGPACHRPSDSHQGDSQCVKPCCSC